MKPYGGGGRREVAGGSVFRREELQRIRDVALAAADEVPNMFWKEALLDLARSADRLDAVMARATALKFCEWPGTVYRGIRPPDADMPPADQR